MDLLLILELVRLLVALFGIVLFLVLGLLTLWTIVRPWISERFGI